MSLAEKITAASVDLDILHQMTVGDVSTDIPLPNGGSVPSLRKLGNNILALLAAGLTATSSAAMLMTEAPHSFIIPSDKVFQVGQWVSITSGAIYALGQITASVTIGAATTLTVNVTQSSNKTTSAGNWVIVLSSPPAPAFSQAQRDEIIALIGATAPAPDTTAPTVTLSSTSTNVTVGGNLTLTATAADNISVARVEFYRNGVLVSSDTTAPFTAVIALTSADNGTVNYTAKAFDAAGNNTTSSAVAVLVNIPVPDVTPPTVSLASSSVNVTTAGNITLTATAADNIGVARIEFYRDATLINTDLTAPFSTVVALSTADNGTAVFTAKAFDAAGNNVTSNAMSVVVNIVAVDSVSPTVTLASSSATVTTASTINLTATAADNVGVTKVEFYRGAMLITTDLTSPFTSSVALSNADNGTLSFTAKAFDAAGNSTVSSVAAVTVNIPSTPITVVTVDATTTTAINTAMTAAAKPNKRMAGANALVSAMNPDHRLIISQNNIAIMTVEYTGDLLAVSDSSGVYVTPSATMDSVTVSQNADLTVGTWKFDLVGGSSYARIVSGSVGATGSGAALELSNNPEVGAGFVDAFKLMFNPASDA